MTPVTTDAVADLPPSCKLVWYVLDGVDEPLTRAEIVDETLLKERTADYALRRLVESDVVAKDRVVEDVVRPRYRCNI